MKISKLFHWLYAILLLLPVVMFLGYLLYFAFNTNSYMSYDSNINGSNFAYVCFHNVMSNSLFSWSATSFLVSPFSYIANLFGMPTNSDLITLLSYWLNISIIWLIFDIVMYVPLLAHRWLDKGVKE